jgi:hypothetical protein
MGISDFAKKTIVPVLEEDNLVLKDMNNLDSETVETIEIETISGLNSEEVEARLTSIKAKLTAVLGHNIFILRSMPEGAETPVLIY